MLAGATRAVIEPAFVETRGPFLVRSVPPVGAQVDAHRFVRLEQPNVCRTQLKLFPSRRRLLPTRLGNALRAYEDTAGERYGHSTVVTYPRLYPVVSDRLRHSLSEFIDQLDTAAGLTISFLLATAVSAIALIDDGWWLVIPLGTACLAAVSYRGAVRAASYQCELLATAFDLHRFDLLAAATFAAAAYAAGGAQGKRRAIELS